MQSIKNFVLYFMIILLAGLQLSATVFAQEELNIDEIRKELREAAAKSAVEPNTLPVEINAAVPQGQALEEATKSVDASNNFVELTNENLAKEEAELLKKLNKPAEQPEALPSATPTEQQQSLKHEDISQHLQADKKSIEVEVSAKVVDAAPSRSETANIIKKDPKEAVLKEQIQEIAGLRKVKSDLDQKLISSEAQISKLKKQLAEANNRLMLAETEVERLSNVLDSRNRMTTSIVSGKAAQSIKSASVSNSLRSKPDGDMPYVTVIADKANLRTGPGAENSPLMAVSKGTRLVVEKHDGEWYRVVTPTGTRAWVSSEVVAFDSNIRNKTIRVKGYDAALENMASSMVPRISE